jgi:threonine aldolase
MDARSIIDLRSDTVTRPTPPMLKAMMAATVGDDVFGEDDTVNELQRQAAGLFGKETALFCPTGTMTNQIAVKLHTQPGDEVICHELSHIYLYEGGGVAYNSGASVRLLRGDNGRFTAEQVRDNINRREDSHFPYTRLVSVENTVNKGGGCCWSFEELERIRAVCVESGLALHLDGARLFNALAARGRSPRDYGAIFDTISICLSKGLGAPAGSLLLGSKEHIGKAHRIRKVMGGGMRQAGYIAAAGLYALNHHVDRLCHDHRKAAALGAELGRRAYVLEVLPVETNIVIFRLHERATPERFLAHLGGLGIKALTVGKQTIRCVFHLDVSDAQFETIEAAIRSFG